MSSIPVGVRDYGPKEMILRNQMLDSIRNTFKLYGGNEIDTSILELTETLQHKYGEESKLIFDMKDEKTSLRYDLTKFNNFDEINTVTGAPRHLIPPPTGKFAPPRNSKRPAPSNDDILPGKVTDCVF